MRAQARWGARIPPSTANAPGIFVQWGEKPIGSRRVAGDTAPVNEELRDNVAVGGYVVDVHAVAEAMIKRERQRLALDLGVLVAPQVPERGPVLAPQDEASAFGDAA